MQIGHGVVRHTRKRAAARQVRRPGTSAPDGRTLFRTSTSTFRVQKRKSDLLRYETLQPHSLDVLFDLFSWCMHGCIFVCMLVMMCLFFAFCLGVSQKLLDIQYCRFFPLAVPDPWLSSRDASLRSRCSISGGRCMARCYSSPLYLRDACACTVYEHTHHPLPPRHRDLFFSLFSILVVR
ncbi:hypothetical protein J3E68DRAFT_358637 [Trichoderma sp. SZMC 28012]